MTRAVLIGGLQGALACGPEAKSGEDGARGETKGLTGRPRLSAREREGGRGRACGLAGRGDGWWAACGRERTEGEREAVGRAARGGKKEKKEEKKMAGPKGKKEGDKNIIQMFSLNLNSKFKSK
jgi:hypothetical protein